MQNFGGQVRWIMGNVKAAKKVDWVAGQQAQLKQPD